MAVLSLALLACSSSALRAQNLFSGAWKLDQGRSHLAGASIEFIPAVENAIQLSSHGSDYSFRVDGKNYRMASGELASWTQPKPGVWQTRYALPTGKPLRTSEWTLSADRRTLTAVTTGSKPDGQSFRNVVKYTRTGSVGDPNSLLGTWKATSVHLGSPNEMEIAEYGLAGLSIKIPAEKFSLLASFDGRDVVPTGPDVPPGLTMALMRIGPSSFRMVRKINGKVTYSARFRVSSDQSTMTETGNAPGDPAQVAVWEKE